MSLKLSRSMNSAAAGGLVALRAGERLFGAVEDQGPVREAGQRVVGGEEGELLLAPGERLVGAAALFLEALATSAAG